MNYPEYVKLLNDNCRNRNFNIFKKWDVCNIDNDNPRECCVNCYPYTICSSCESILLKIKNEKYLCTVDIEEIITDIQNKLETIINVLDIKNV